MPQMATASAPASIGNVGVGYDVLGLAFDAVRDTITARRVDRPGVHLGQVSGLTASLPAEVHKNCALAAAHALIASQAPGLGVVLDIHKGVPMSAGMGGSAASAVAAAAAVNALLETPLETPDLLLHAIEGERVSADPPPWDNVMASLLGGLVIAARLDPPLIRRLPLPEGYACVLFHPNRKIETQMARELLSETVSHAVAVEHGRNLAGFLAGCALGDEALIEAGLQDILIEPQRLPLLPELAGVQSAAIGAGALGCSFSGSGPSVFAWCRATDKTAVRDAMARAFADADCEARAYDAPILSDGVTVERVSDTSVHESLQEKAAS